MGGREEDVTEEKWGERVFELKGRAPVDHGALDESLPRVLSVGGALRAREVDEAELGHFGLLRALAALLAHHLEHKRIRS